MRGYSDYGFDKIALSARGSSHARLFYRRAGQSFDFLSSHVLSLSLLLLLLPLLPLLPLILKLPLLPLLVTANNAATAAAAAPVAAFTPAAA